MTSYVFSIPQVTSPWIEPTADLNPATEADRAMCDRGGEGGRQAFTPIPKERKCFYSFWFTLLLWKGWVR